MGDSLTPAVTSPSITRPMSLWLGLPGLLEQIDLGAEGKRQHRARTALAIPYLRSEA